MNLEVQTRGLKSIIFRWLCPTRGYEDSASKSTRIIFVSLQVASHMFTTTFHHQKGSAHPLELHIS